MLAEHWRLSAMIPLVTEWSETNRILVELSLPRGSFLSHVVLRINVSVNGLYEDMNHRDCMGNRNVDEYICKVLTSRPAI